MNPETGGGQCEYRVYPGRARIVSVRSKRLPRGYPGPPYEPVEIKFQFYTTQKIIEPHGRVEGKQFDLQLANSWYPGPGFIRKYKIEKDKIFDCFLHVIVHGVCTPVRFEFPDIDLEDYFEAKICKRRIN